MKSFGQFIKHARKARGMSVEDVADFLRCGETHLYEMESGRRSPPPMIKTKKYVKLARKLKVDYYELKRRGAVERAYNIIKMDMDMPAAMKMLRERMG